MTTKVCPECGKEFTAKSNRQIYCSAKCCNKFNHKLNQIHVTSYTCAHCGKAFKSNQRKKYCSYECCVKANTKTKKRRTIYSNKAQKSRKTFMPLSLPQINKLAREQGLTYGQYMAKIYAEEIKND